MRSDRCSVSAARCIVACALVLGGCYASSTLEDGASGTRLRRIVLRPQDGEPSFAGWYDRELEADCAFERTEDGRIRCLPRARLVFHYEDPGCSAPVVEVSDDDCEEWRFGREDVFPRGCGEIPGFRHTFEIDEAVVSIDRVYERHGEECVASERSFPRARRMTRVDPTRFVAGESVPAEDTGAPLLRDRLVTEDGATGLGALRDRARDAACGLPYPFELERQPCLPTSARTRTGGASCDQQWAEWPADCAPPSLAYAYQPDGCGLPTEARVFAVGDAVAVDDRELGAACDGYPYDGAVYRTRPADDEVPWLTRAWRGEGRLQRAIFVNDAGDEVLTSALRYRDRELGVVCTVTYTTEGIRCLPDLGQANSVGRAPRVGTHFADEACVEPAAAVRTGCLTEFVVSRAPADVCSGSTIDGVYRVGAPLERVYHRDESGACVLDESGVVAHALTPVPLSTLALVERTIE